MSQLNDLLYMMRRLRDPDTGCPWDLEQNFDTIAPYTLEETCEVLEAIAQKDYENLEEELGDLLFQVVFHAQMADEAGHFDFEKVVSGIVTKMVRRHPHVFPDRTLNSIRSQDDETTPDEVIDRWQQIKAEEKQSKGKVKAVSAMPEKLPSALPALTRAYKIQKAAAKVGFDWPDFEPVLDKIQEEIVEIKLAVSEEEGLSRVAEEVGDLLFACVNLARHLGVEPDMAMRQANEKFESRFRSMEQSAQADGYDFQQLSLDEMEAYWQQAK